jgi:hypothetical protein
LFQLDRSTELLYLVRERVDDRTNNQHTFGEKEKTMTGQTWRWSMIEAWTNVLVGLGLALAANWYLLGSMGHALTVGQNIRLAGA